MMSFTPPYQQYGKQVGLLVFPANSNADGFKTPGSHYLVLPVNPNIQLTRPYRTTPTQTIQGAYVDDFGLGVALLTLSGHTGYWIGTGQYQGQPVDGHGAYKALDEEIIQYYFLLESQQAKVQPAVTMQFFNNIDGQFLDLKPTQNFQLTRSASKPFLYQFQATFIVLADHHTEATTPVYDPIDPLLAGGMSFPNPSLMPVSVSTTTTRPSSQSPSAQSAPAQSLKVIVKAGNTLWGIASQYVSPPATNAKINAEIQAIAHASHLANPNLIYPGQVLTVPR
jgi:hypothetical protein